MLTRGTLLWFVAEIVAKRCFFAIVNILFFLSVASFPRSLVRRLGGVKTIPLALSLQRVVNEEGERLRMLLLCV